MSMKMNYSTAVAQCSPTRLTEELGQEIVSKFTLSVSDEFGVNVHADQIVEVDSNGLYVHGTYEIGEHGKPRKDSSEYAEKIMGMVNHDTCLTGETEGYPVWFENAAWCNECEKLYAADDQYIGEIDCNECGAHFPRNGIMRATTPSVLVFEERIEFDTPVDSIEELVEATREALTN